MKPKKFSFPISEVVTQGQREGTTYIYIAQTHQKYCRTCIESQMYYFWRIIPHAHGNTLFISIYEFPFDTKLKKKERFEICRLKKFLTICVIINYFIE